MLPKLAILFPLVLCIVSFVLCLLALFAGHKEGFMEDYAVVRLNTSMVGHGLFDSDSDKDGSDDSKSGGLLGDIQDAWHDVKGDAQDKLNEITGDIADKVANAVGISEWYSIHVMDACEGNFSPNATITGASLNITNCTSSSPAYRLNLTKILDHELDVGPFDLNLAKINWPEGIQDKLDILNDALLGLFVVYVLGVAFSGLAILCCIAAILGPADKRVTMLANMLVAGLGALSVLIGSIIVTVAGNNGVKQLNRVGKEAGVSAERGAKFYALTWASTGFMIVATLFWLGKFVMATRKRKMRHSKESY